MALKGNLRDFSFLQLLNLIHLAHKTGGVVIDGSMNAAQVNFQEGKLVYAQSNHEENNLAWILFKAKKLTYAQYKVISERAGAMSDKELGLLLINANYLSQKDILQCIQNHYVYIVNQLITWQDGDFRFENEMKPPPGKINVRINLENIILEGSRRLKEWEQLIEEIPSLDMALKFVDRPQVNIRNIHLTPIEWKVITYINPKNSINQIARAIGLDELEIRRVIYGLLQAGLVQIVRPDGVVRPTLPQRPATAPPTTKPSKEVRISIVHRLIQRIRSIPT
jgi:hypothetical protein